MWQFCCFAFIPCGPLKENNPAFLNLRLKKRAHVQPWKIKRWLEVLGEVSETLMNAAKHTHSSLAFTQAHQNAQRSEEACIAACLYELLSTVKAHLTIITSYYHVSLFLPPVSLVFII